MSTRLTTTTHRSTCGFPPAWASPNGTGGAGVDALEEGAQQQVAPLRGVAQLTAGRAVVPELGERAAVRVEFIRPVRLGAGRVQHHQPDGIPGKAPHGAEPARIASAGQELTRWIVRFISGRAALVDMVQHQVVRSDTHLKSALGYWLTRH
jgi:hypothetical protein